MATGQSGTTRYLDASPRRVYAQFSTGNCDAELWRHMQHVGRASRRPVVALAPQSISRRLMDDPGRTPPAIAGALSGILAQRFVLKKRLGSGAFGVVYEAFDLQRRATVALKQLTALDPVSVWRFKMEFRALADVSHPNLVTLHELFLDNGTWFFTMELIVGKDFFEYVRGSDSQDCRCDLVRLRRVLAQLVGAIHACHTAGYLHRDIKPSNTLIRSDGHLILLDFGLLAATDLTGKQARFQGSFTGTPAYMAPERFTNQPSSRASDWYSVGVMLVEALTGDNPFDGNAFEALRRKQRDDWVAGLLSSAPKDLRILSEQLLRSAPEARPDHYAISKALGPATESVSAITAPAFLGRRNALSALERALNAAREGRTTIARVHGPSGIGKTALIQTFLRTIVSDPAIVLLEGRCYEHESVPYNAFDVLLDNLVERLSEDESALIGELDSSFLGALARVFPSFGRLKALDGVNLTFDPSEAVDQRDRAFVGLRLLLRTVAARHKLVMFLDDLQWADRDSAAVLRAIFEDTQAFPILLIVTHRDDATATQGGMMAALIEIGARPSVQSCDVDIGPLTREESERLVQTLAPGRDEASVRAVCEESAGHPFFLCELALAISSSSEINGASLQALITARVARLPLAARHLIEVTSVAGRPVAATILCAVGEPDASADAIAVLRRARLVKTVSGTASDLVNVYHDRIREAVISGMSTERRALLHRFLAEELERLHTGEPEDLMVHWQSCGEPSRAARYAELAADRATRALAFERATRLYRTALAVPLYPTGSKNHRSLLRKLGDALFYAGRGTDSARAYAEASVAAPYMEGVDLRRLAAEQFLRSGQIDEGLEMMQGVLKAVDLALPSNPRSVFASLFFERAFLRVRGLHFREQSIDQVPLRELARIDACWSARTGLSLVDYVLHAAFQSRHLIFALRAGEPYRVSRALIAEAGLLGGSGLPTCSRADELLAAGRGLAERLADPYLIASGLLTKGANEFFLGRWRSSLTYLKEAERIFRESCRGVTWDVSTTHIFSLSALRYLGDMTALGANLEIHVKRAEQLGDLYASVSILLHTGTLVFLAKDDPEGALRQLAATRARWSYQQFQVQQWLGLSGEVDILLYQGRGREALDLFEKNEAPFKRSFLDKVQILRVEWHYRRALSALQVRLGDDTPFVKIARDAARKIEREKVPWAAPFAEILWAALAARAGRFSAARALTQRAVVGFEAADMLLYAAASRCRLAVSADGRIHEPAQHAALSEIRAQGVANPACWADLYMPAFDSTARLPAQGPKPGPIPTP